MDGNFEKAACITLLGLYTITEASFYVCFGDLNSKYLLVKIW